MVGEVKASVSFAVLTVHVYSIMAAGDDLWPTVWAPGIASSCSFNRGTRPDEVERCEGGSPLLQRTIKMISLNDRVVAAAANTAVIWRMCPCAISATTLATRSSLRLRRAWMLSSSIYQGLGDHVREFQVRCTPVVTRHQVKVIVWEFLSCCGSPAHEIVHAAAQRADQ